MLLHPLNPVLRTFQFALPFGIRIAEIGFVPDGGGVGNIDEVVFGAEHFPEENGVIDLV